MEKTFDKIERGEFFLIAGPCVIESEKVCLTVADKLSELSDRLQLPIIFKSSFEKANRTSAGSYTGPGMDVGLKVLGRIRQDFGLPVLTDIHETTQVDAVAEVADVLQIPAFLCRQTALIHKAGATGKWVNIKKGQFLAPEDMALAAKKAETEKVMLTERGSSFGYRNLVVDFRSLIIMRKAGYPVVFDATHSLQLPGGGDGVSLGQPEFIFPMASAAAAVGINGLFVETHPDPQSAKSDAAAMLPLDRLEELVQTVKRIRAAREAK